MSWTIKGNGTGDNLLYSQAGTPSLDLRFASTKTLTDYVSNSNLITFTRASSGTYVGSDGLIKTAATNEARFDHNPTTGESLGLLVEEQRTNLLLRSEEFDNASWVKANASVVANIETSPSGDLTADLFVPSTAVVTKAISQPVLTVSTAYSLSVYAKAAGLRYIALSNAGSPGLTGIFDLQAGVVSSTGASAATRITPVGNGWYRCTCSFTAGFSSASIYAAASGTSAAGFAGDGSSGYLVWGAQVEAGSFPTSYIPTTSATVTRSDDVANVDNVAWLSGSQGTLLSQTKLLDGQGNTNSKAVVTLRSISSSTHAHSLYSNFVWRGLLNGALSDMPALPYTTNSTKLSFSYSTDGRSACKDAGSVITESGDCSIPLANRLSIGATGHISSIAGYSQIIRRLTYWPQRLPNATLQAITQ